MMYPFMTLENDTEIVHSEKLENGEVKVYVETPDERDGFHNMRVCQVKCVIYFIFLSVVVIATDFYCAIHS